MARYESRQPLQVEFKRIDFILNASTKASWQEQSGSDTFWSNLADQFLDRTPTGGAMPRIHQTWGEFFFVACDDRMIHTRASNGITGRGMSRQAVSFSIPLLAVNSRSPVSWATTRMSHCDNPQQVGGEAVNQEVRKASQHEPT